MDNATNDLLYSLPKDGKDYSYASVAADLDDADIPKERIPKLKELMRGTDDFLAVEAAKTLTCWGEDEAFDFLESFVCDREPIPDNWMPHRLHNYDDSYKHILAAFKTYWATKSTRDYEGRTTGEGAKARKKLLRPVLRIIGLSSFMQFDISGFFWLIKDDGFTEYIPALKAHLEAILKNPDLHRWKIRDCIYLLMKFDPEFVKRALAKHGKTLADYPNK
jgi:hypothetical protein